MSAWGYIPRTKAELIERLLRARPAWKVSDLRRKRKNQLLAIWFKVCEENRKAAENG